MASDFAKPFGAEKTAEIAGLLHDCGKASDAFQRRIRGSPERVDHSTAGAQELLRLGQLEAAFAVAGHHGGLPDGGTRGDSPDDPTLVGRSKKQVEPYLKGTEEIPLPELPFAPRTGFEQSFFIRMLYSCLVDADYLDTEAFMQGSPPPRGSGESIPALLEKVRRQAAHWLNAPTDNPVNQARNQILQSCIDLGRTEKPGLFTLTAPTGGSKTFSSLAFAMEHAAKHHMTRIVYILPYTSIIDQTMDVFNDILGEENVLGHYSSADFQLRESDEMSVKDYAKALASENWDSPVIVTTAVQFFESLFSNRSSRCRKLHNISNAVLIFDEAQTLPVDYLMPCLASIAQLVQHYGSTAVLCTATQPALAPYFQKLAPELPLREICPNSLDLFASLRRTTLKQIGSLSQTELAARLAASDQVLCVVNRRQTAQTIYAMLPKDGSYCLTTLLCAADRREKLEEIRMRLRQGKPCRVVSTSLIEAGVDVDFPVAYREEAGLDSVLQTAGRCNREGRRNPEESFVYLFSLADVSPPQALSQNRNALHHVLRRCPEDLQSPEAVEIYFKSLYSIKGDQALDKKGILDAFNRGRNGCTLPFALVSEEFHIIEAPTKTVYLPIGQGKVLCDQLQREEYSKALFRKLGMYSVSLYPNDFERLDRAGALICTGNDAGILNDLRIYDPNLGLTFPTEDGQAFIS
ncbi:MAG: CRISPR-associated helicase Cas3' [Oscillospiraceae bacterium]|nr:CRISPR-associated helicase Cas3' [Oscillospiraceae bacterium]